MSLLFLWGSSHQWLVSHSSPGSGERHQKHQCICQICDWLLSSQPSQSSFCLEAFPETTPSATQQQNLVFQLSHNTETQVSRGSQCRRVGGYNPRAGKSVWKHVSFRVKRQWFRPPLLPACYSACCIAHLLELRFPGFKVSVCAYRAGVRLKTRMVKCSTPDPWPQGLSDGSLMPSSDLCSNIMHSFFSK